MARLTAGQTALILDRLRKADMESEADALEQHIEALTSENRWLDQLQQVTAATVKSAEAEANTAAAVRSFEVVVRSAVVVLERVSRTEERRVALEERQEAAGLKVTEMRYAKVWGPIALALAGALGALIQHFLG